MTKNKSKEIFNAAKSFYSGAKVILESAQSNMRDQTIKTFHFPILPCITNMVFSLELFIKCLLVVEGKNPRHIHNIYKLYEELSEKTKNSLFIKASERKEGESLLQEIANAFEDWRYSYEKSFLEINLEKMDEVIKIFRDYIIFSHIHD